MRKKRFQHRESFPGIERIIKAFMVLTVVSLAYDAGAEENGILRKQSQYGFHETVERFEAAARASGIKIFPRFDHAAAAGEYNLPLLPLVVISFGNPKYGTKFMADAPLAGIDFPPKALVYEDDSGKVWLAYNSAKYLYEVIFERHGLDYSADEIETYAELLEELTNEAVQ
ncbi:MAG: DUF302 domain-containing protein [Verrucomicrobiota bacterium]